MIIFFIEVKGLPESWKDVFHRFNKKATPSRRAILEVFEEKGRHLSAEDVYEHLRAKKKKVGIATVYRNLDLLLRMGILRKVNFGDGREHYEMIRRAAQFHHHLICTRCGQVVDCEGMAQEEERFLQHLRKELEQRQGFAIHSYHIYFYGLCPRCR
jgi:Fur family ferric uptake transcriptional regulator